MEIIKGWHTSKNYNESFGDALPYIQEYQMGERTGTVVQSKGVFRASARDYINGTSYSPDFGTLEEAEDWLLNEEFKG